MTSMLTKDAADAFAAEWIAAWNSHDLDRILSHYSDDFEFSSPYIVQIVGEASGVLRGKGAIREYWRRALERLPDIQFALESVLWSVNTVVINYRRNDGRLAAEWFEFGEGGLVVRSAGHYGA